MSGSVGAEFTRRFYGTKRTLGLQRAEVAPDSGVVGTACALDW